MTTCPGCNTAQPESNAFCSACGVGVNAGFAATVAQLPGDSPVANSVGSSSSVSSHHGHFLPGSKVAERYRIVSLVGKGGMREVYRADDLKLGQTVALKFLPRDFAQKCSTAGTVP